MALEDRPPIRREPPSPRPTSALAEVTGGAPQMPRGVKPEPLPAAGGSAIAIKPTVFDSEAINRIAFPSVSKRALEDTPAEAQASVDVSQGQVEAQASNVSSSDIAAAKLKKSVLPQADVKIRVQTDMAAERHIGKLEEQNKVLQVQVQSLQVALDKQLTENV